MKIALIMENSQAAKSALVESTLRKVVEPMGHEVVNYGMYAADDAAQLTYVQTVSYTHLAHNFRILGKDSDNCRGNHIS